MVAAFWLCGSAFSGMAARVVVIGDSLSAEYEAIPDIPGLENPTAYAQVTKPGWESMSWVEVLGRLRPADFDFGPYRSELLGWGPLRFSGYQDNFAIPGFRAAQYEDIVNSSLLSDPQFLLERSSLAEAISERADRVIIWLGSNEIRANYGFLCEGGDPSSLIENLVHDLSEVIDFVKSLKSGLEIVLVNLPDLSATPSKRADFPDPVARARATAATVRANEALKLLAISKGIPLADAFAKTEKFVQGQSISFGPVALITQSNPDNNPVYAFARDGLHPNTALQIEVARTLIDTCNTSFRKAIPQISNGEALRFLGLATNQPYSDWITAYGVTQAEPGGDPDQDTIPNIAEYTFDLDPTQPSLVPVRLTRKPGALQLDYHWNDAPERQTQVVPQASVNLADWTDLSSGSLQRSSDGNYTVFIPIASSHVFLRLSVQPRQAENQN